MDGIVTDEFIYDEEKRWYAVVIEGMRYLMPYVMTLKFKRFETNLPQLKLKDRIEKWYDSLDDKERRLVERKPV